MKKIFPFQGVSGVYILVAEDGVATYGGKSVDVSSRVNQHVLDKIFQYALFTPVDDPYIRSIAEYFIVNFHKLPLNRGPVKLNYQERKTLYDLHGMNGSKAEKLLRRKLTMRRRYSLCKSFLERQGQFRELLDFLENIPKRKRRLRSGSGIDPQYLRCYARLGMRGYELNGSLVLENSCLELP